MELSDELYDRIEELSETGNEAMESEDYAKAISCFQEALDILPEPKEDWEAYLWLAGSIGDAHFMMGNYGKSLEFFRKCYNIGETDNPFILLRLGENYLEMEDETNATENHQSKKIHRFIMRSWANFHHCNLSASDGEFFLFDSSSD